MKNSTLLWGRYFSSHIAWLHWGDCCHPALLKVLSETLMPHIKDLWHPCCQFPDRSQTTSKSVDKTYKRVYHYDTTIVILLLKSTNYAFFTYIRKYTYSFSVFSIPEVTVAAFCCNKPHYITIIRRHCFKGGKCDCEQGQISASTVLLFLWLQVKLNEYLCGAVLVNAEYAQRRSGWKADLWDWNPVQRHRSWVGGGPAGLLVAMARLKESKPGWL